MMNYRSIFKNSYLYLNFHTNSERIHKLINNFVDFKNISSSNPKIKITFYIAETTNKTPAGDDDFFYRNYNDKGANSFSSFGGKIASVITNSKTGIVKGVISGYRDSFKERILDFMFCQPLRTVLLRHGLFYLHASAICKDNNCILISGPSHSGKSTVALSLITNKFHLIADDCCFAKLTADQIYAFPFLTKMGLSDELIKRYPQFNKYVISKYRYGGKKRISTSDVASSPDINDLTYKCKILIFPEYRASGKIDIRRFSKEEALERLTRQMPFIYQKKALKKMFKFLCGLTAKTDSFRLLYNDNSLADIPGALEKIF